jgi:hypothetical protein
MPAPGRPEIIAMPAIMTMARTSKRNQPLRPRPLFPGRGTPGSFGELSTAI